MSKTDIVYERRGAGTPLVLLHGIGHHRHAWGPVLDRLAQEHDVIAVDLPGFGQSPLPASGVPAGMPGAVAGMLDFFAALGLRRPHVAGNSLGGGIALELAAVDAVASATALSPAGFCTPREARWAVGVLNTHRIAAHLPQPVVRWAARSGALRTLSYGMIFGRPRRLTPEMAFADAMAMRAARGFKTVAKSARSYAYEGQPAGPVTVAWGTRDRILPYRQAALARERLPAARHVALTGCGHVPMNDDPDLVARVILDTTGGA
jgi:pimeloyl-ACP methyl ester carboxylesterase